MLCTALMRRHDIVGVVLPSLFMRRFLRRHDMGLAVLAVTTLVTAGRHLIPFGNNTNSGSDQTKGE